MTDTAIPATTADTFEIEVLARSHERPVVVDFWADWCGPCHQLSPVLGRVAERHADDVDVVKLDIDAAPVLARRFGIQGIPAVKAFRDGRVVDEFTGVQPEREIAAFFGRLVPSLADRLVAAAETDPAPEERLHDALAAEPGHAGALVALAERLADRGEFDEARRLLVRAPQDARARELASRLSLAEAGSDDLAALRERAESDPAARVELGRALAGHGAHEDAVEELLHALRERTAREDARTALLDVFAVLGDDHELVRRSRPRLAAALYA